MHDFSAGDGTGVGNLDADFYIFLALRDTKIGVGECRIRETVTEWEENGKLKLLVPSISYINILFGNEMLATALIMFTSLHFLETKYSGK